MTDTYVIDRFSNVVKESEIGEDEPRQERVKCIARIQISILENENPIWDIWNLNDYHVTDSKGKQQIKLDKVAVIVGFMDCLIWEKIDYQGQDYR